MSAQVDLRREAEHLAQFRVNFPPSGRVLFPAPLGATRHVLVETWEDGEPLHAYLAQAQDHSPKEREDLARLGLDMCPPPTPPTLPSHPLRYLAMMLRHNLVHADLHPGNLAVRRVPSPSDGPPQLCLLVYDAGLVTAASPEDWRNFRSLFGAIVTGDAGAGAALMLRQARRAPTLTPEQEAAFTAEMKTHFEAAVAVPLRQVRVGALLLGLLRTSQRFGVPLEGNFATLCVGTLVLEGVGRQLDPAIDLLRAARPFYPDLAKTLKDTDPSQEEASPWELLKALLRHRLGFGKRAGKDVE